MLFNTVKFRLGAIAVIGILFFLAAGSSSHADTCSYTWDCHGSSQCAYLMGGPSGTKTASGTTQIQAPGSSSLQTVPVNKQNCEQARTNMNAQGFTSACTCTPGGATGASMPGFQLKSTGSAGGDVVNDAAQMWILQNIKNPYTTAFAQNFTQSFITGYVANQQRQQQIQAQIEEQQREQAEQARIAEQKRVDAMFDRLNHELKLSGDSTDLSLKTGSDSGNLQLKLSASNSDQLQLKLGDDQPQGQGYGIRGLEGVYTGGPAPAVPSNDATGGLKLKLGDDNSNAAPATDASQMGIPGLPGINLNDIPPQQAPQVAVVASQMTGPDQAVAEDAALHAAEKNPELTAPTTDPIVADYQQSAKEYDDAEAQRQTALQQAAAAQGHVQADQTALNYANNVVQSGQATDAQKAGLAQLQAAEGSDENLAAAARAQFDGAEIHVVTARNNAINALSSLAPPPADTSAPPKYTGPLPVLDINAKPILFASRPTGGRPIYNRPVAQKAPAETIGQCLARTGNLPPGSAVPSMETLQQKLEGTKKALDGIEKSFDENQELNEDWRKTWHDGWKDVRTNALDKAVESYYNGTEDALDEAEIDLHDEIGETTKEAGALHQQMAEMRSAMAKAQGDPAKMKDLQQEWDALQVNQVDPLLKYRKQLDGVWDQYLTSKKRMDSFTASRDFGQWVSDNEVPCRVVNYKADCSDIVKKNDAETGYDMNAGRYNPTGLSATTLEGMKQVLKFAAHNAEYLNYLKGLSYPGLLAVKVAAHANFIEDTWDISSFTIDMTYDVTALSLSYQALQQVKTNDAGFARARQTLNNRMDQINGEIGCYKKGGLNLNLADLMPLTVAPGQKTPSAP